MLIRCAGTCCEWLLILELSFVSGPALEYICVSIHLNKQYYEELDMSQLVVKLSNEPPEGVWPEQSLLSFKEETVTIHIKESMRIKQIQAGVRRLLGMGFEQFKLSGDFWDKEAQFAFVQASYRPAGEAVQVELQSMSSEENQDLAALIEVNDWTRTQINRTPEDCSPVSLAEESAAFITALAPDEVSSVIVQGDKLLEEGWIGIHGVGRGSDRPPALLVLDYTPKGWGDKPPFAALVGKGITFDSGGYSIKVSERMLPMKADMGGAATVAGALALAIMRGLNKRVQLILCCAENLISGGAYKLGDVLHYKNGVSVEVVNTDAEGRLVLADGLIMACEAGAELVIDAATLTGASITALGLDYNAVFSMDDALRERILQYAESESEPHWPLPLSPFHAAYCPSYYADTANSVAVKGGGPGGASKAAGFLSRFVTGCRWAHFDLSGAMLENDSSYLSAGGTALGVRTIARALLEENQESLKS